MSGMDVGGRRPPSESRGMPGGRKWYSSLAGDAGFESTAVGSRQGDIIGGHGLQPSCGPRNGKASGTAV